MKKVWYIICHSAILNDVEATYHVHIFSGMKKVSLNYFLQAVGSLSPVRWLFVAQEAQLRQLSSVILFSQHCV